MDAVTLENHRCFRRPQNARLAPLTLLAGGNSTGKTSFLALIRALWNVAFQDSVPDFRAEPYDMGAFADVVHSRGGRSGRPDSFTAGFVFDGEVSGARPLYTNDRALQDDFKNTLIVEGVRGRVYTTLQRGDVRRVHRDLLGRNDLCNV